MNGLKGPLTEYKGIFCKVNVLQAFSNIQQSKKCSDTCVYFAACKGVSYDSSTKECVIHSSAVNDPNKETGSYESRNSAVHTAITQQGKIK